MKALKPNIGLRSDEGFEGTPLLLDAHKLVYSRALVQANSGGGKSGLIRVIAEQVASHIPTIIIDKEGEFHTLREKIDLILVGEQGELPVDVRSAGLLARKLVEVGASAVIDLSSFTKAGPMQECVANFLDALINLPKKLWHPTFIILDEAQFFAPEKSFGESIATQAVINLMTLGRKRGFCGLLCTPRIAALNKNAANVNNVFIGRTQLDTDQSRAGRDLGMKPKDAIILRELEPREFYAFGPDLGVKGVAKFRVADCLTTIPKPGDRKSLIPPKASHVVKEIAEKLKDLPQQAEAEIRDLADAKAALRAAIEELKEYKSDMKPRDEDAKTIARLEGELQIARTKVREKIKIVEKRIVIDKNITRLEKLQSDLGTRGEALIETVESLKAQTAATAKLLEEARGLNEMNLVAPEPEERSLEIFEPGFAVKQPPEKYEPPPHPPTPPPAQDGDEKLPPRIQAVLDALRELELLRIPQPSRKVVAVFAKRSPSSSSYDNDLSNLKAHRQFVTYPRDGLVSLTEEGRARAAEPTKLTTRAQYHERWFALLEPRKVKVLKVLIEHYPKAFDRETLAQMSDRSGASSSYDNDLSSMRSLGVIDYPQDGYVVGTDLLFPAGL